MRFSGTISVFFLFLAADFSILLCLDFLSLSLSCSDFVFKFLKYFFSLKGH
jgi:hypothetical protein